MDQLTSLWGKHRLDQWWWAKPLCPLPKGLLLRPGKGVSEISVGQHTAPPVTKGRTILQLELFKSNVDGVRQCCWSTAQALVSRGQRRTRAIRQQDTPKHWTRPLTHQVQCLGQKSHSSSYRPKLQNQALVLKRFRIGFGQSKHWPRQKI